MLGGVHGKILHINLSNGEIHVETPPENLYRLLVGGRALVAYLLLRDLPARTDPLSPDNLLIFARSPARLVPARPAVGGGMNSNAPATMRW